MTPPKLPFELSGVHRLVALLTSVLLFLGMNRFASAVALWWTKRVCLSVFKQLEPETLVTLVSIIGSSGSNDAKGEGIIKTGEGIVKMMRTMRNMREGKTPEKAR